MVKFTDIMNFAEINPDNRNFAFSQPTFNGHIHEHQPTLSPYDFRESSKLPDTKPKEQPATITISKNEMVTMDGETEPIKLYSETELFFDGKLELESENGVKMHIVCENKVKSIYETLKPDVFVMKNVPKLSPVQPPTYYGLSDKKTMQFDMRADPQINYMPNGVSPHVKGLYNPQHQPTRTLNGVLGHVSNKDELEKRKEYVQVADSYAETWLGLGGSNKNMTYDIRSEPPCPKTVISPFLNSSIMPDTKVSSESSNPDITKKQIGEFYNAMLQTTIGKSIVKSLNVDDYCGVESDDDEEQSIDEQLREETNKNDDDAVVDEMKEYILPRNKPIEKSFLSSPPPLQPIFSAKKIIINFKGIPIASNVETEMKLTLSPMAKIIVAKGTTVFMELAKGVTTKVTLDEEMVCKVRQ